MPILFDLNKYYFDPNYNPQDFINRSKINNIFISVGRILMSFIKYPVQDIKNFRGLPDKGKTWVFTATSRHYMSVYGLESHVENLIFLNSRGQVGGDRIYFLPRSISVIFLPVSFFVVALSMLLNVKRFDRYINGFFDIIFTIPRVVNNIVWIKFLRPKKIIILNDFKSESLSLAYAAKKCGIPIISIPHGISYVFSGKLICDRYLVYGESQAKDYCKDINECMGKVRIVGSIKYSQLNKIKQRKRVQSLCIATNIGVNRAILSKIIKEIKAKSAIQIVLRPHPGQDLEKMSKELCVDYSNPDSEDLNALFQRIGCVVSYGSNILLDSAYVGVMSLSFDMYFASTEIVNRHAKILNRFVDDGVCKEVFSVDDILNALDHNLELIQEQRRAVQSYISTTHNPFQEIAREIALL
jgi:hypothetical protein